MINIHRRHVNCIEFLRFGSAHISHRCVHFFHAIATASAAVDEAQRVGLEIISCVVCATRLCRVHFAHGNI